jgi:hypothetical protein
MIRIALPLLPMLLLAAAPAALSACDGDGDGRAYAWGDRGEHHHHHYRHHHDDDARGWDGAASGDGWGGSRIAVSAPRLWVPPVPYPRFGHEGLGHDLGRVGEDVVRVATLPLRLPLMLLRH